MEQLKAYHWPGNVRELENMIERALIRYQSRSGDRFLRFDELAADQSRPSAAICGNEDVKRPLSLDDVMGRHIEDVLRSTGGKIQGKDGAAAILGIHPSTLRSRMNKLGIAYGHKPKNRHAH